MCRFDHDPTLPAPWLRRLWRTIVIGGILWLLTGPEARAARLSPALVPGASQAAPHAVEAADAGDPIQQVHAPPAH